MTNGALRASSHLSVVEGSRAHPNARIAEMSATTTAPDLSVSDWTRSNIDQGLARRFNYQARRVLTPYDSIPAAYYNDGHASGTRVSNR